MRVDLMSKMRGLAPFASLWKRRTVIELPGGTTCNLLSLPDLVQAKKTQRDKDWPMIRRLIEAHYFQNSVKPTTAQVRFWLKELRTPELLVEVVQSHTLLARRLVTMRPLLGLAVLGKTDEVAQALMTEEAAERERDRQYWMPLRAELERLRHAK
jgi:hypothetical protein